MAYIYILIDVIGLLSVESLNFFGWFDLLHDYFSESSSSFFLGCYSD